LLNQDLLTGTRNQPSQLAQADWAIQHGGKDRDFPFAAN